jgi:hypothetical protein
MAYIVRLGAIWLGIVGALLLSAGVLATFIGLGPAGPESGLDFGDFLVAGGLIGLVVGAPQMAAAVGVWRRRTWGRWLSGAVGGIGLAFALLAVIVGSGGLGAVIMAVGYGLALVGSVTWYPTDPPTPT